MKITNYDTFDGYTFDQTELNQKLISEMRELVSKTSPELEETVKWGNGCWVNGKLPVLFVHCEDDHAQIGFFGGAQLDDPSNLLKGDGKYVRHVRIETIADINGELLRPIIKQASAFNYKIK